MKRSVIGILAHVDAGKTTLSEAMLYLTGSIRSAGRVDHGDTFLDTFSMERQRGITIFSKQASFTLGDTEVTLLDTPGHVDFSPEMERTLDVMDAAILVISAPEGVQSHTVTVYQLLRRRNIPVFVFVNKTDLVNPGREAILEDLNTHLGRGFVDAENMNTESAALCDEALLEEYLAGGELSRESIAAAVGAARLRPCVFGSALKLEGVEEFLGCLEAYMPHAKEDYGGFAARVYKISRDDAGVRLTHLRVTGGSLHVRDMIDTGSGGEKVTRIRVYSGAKYRTADAAGCGEIVAVEGLASTFAGQGLGREPGSEPPVLEPVMNYTVIFPDGTDIQKALQCMMTLQEEEPQLHVSRDERLREISVQLMGTVQLEVLHRLILDRFGYDVSFGHGRIIYRETVLDTVEGVGHFEPLRHYAEVHLIISPAERGSGIHISSECREDDLAKNWQRLILTHLAEKKHLGVLTGSLLTDVNIVLASGKAHIKHTEGGDFRQATYRAVRQGLMQAHSVLLEPQYRFRLEVPTNCAGRAVTDLQRMNSEFEMPAVIGGMSVITGTAPVSLMQEYPETVTTYTRGMGRITFTSGGYAPCVNADEVIAEIGYDPENDTRNSPDSVFCSHSDAGIVKWYDVFERMHLPSVLNPPPEEETVKAMAREYVKLAATDKELMQIFERTYGPIKRNEREKVRRAPETNTGSKPYKAAKRPEGPEYLLVDGYNVIFAWDEMKALAAQDLDHARAELTERLRNFQGYKQSPVILVFDAYKVKGGKGSVEKTGDFTVVFTKEAETADMYIEKAAYKLEGKYRVRVATSDGLEQTIILGHGALRTPSSSFIAEVKAAERAVTDYLKEYNK